MSELKYSDLPLVMRCPNRMANVVEFLKCWNSDAGYAPRAIIVCSPWGNLNSTGQGHESSAPDLTPADDSWPEAIEPGVRPLVVLLVGKLGLITYDSCEGHQYPTSLRIQNSPRRIGIIPRNEAEADWILTLIYSAFYNIKQFFIEQKVILYLCRTHLYSEAQPESRWAVLDIEIHPSSRGFDKEYFGGLDTVTNSLVQALEATATTTYIHGM